MLAISAAHAVNAVDTRTPPADPPMPSVAAPSWAGWRTWSADVTYATHESQTLPIERDHSAPATETAWTVAAYQTPVSDRMWHLTATGATPIPMLQDLLHELADGHGWDTPVGQFLDEASLIAATQPATDAGWQHTVEGRWMHWTAPNGEAGIQFDAFAAQRTNGVLPTWLLWAGPTIDHPTWEIAASTRTPSTLLANLAETLTHGTVARPTIPLTSHAHHRTTPPPELPGTAAKRANIRSL
ncbi:DUF317 domain-containing protein [Streptomyces sp. VTCC 41912]|uniref:DUF317 domain-containing protein n=1 Tax=Streptomyces TaxID=1883 RepID=UPI001F2FB80E|nr:DUF317 domain-containing protein [Streptomyces noursei]MCE4941929.1 DUF317 domain-containing protein [Streptomyces noursei]